MKVVFMILALTAALFSNETLFATMLDSDIIKYEISNNTRHDYLARFQGICSNSSNIIKKNQKMLFICSANSNEMVMEELTQDNASKLTCLFSITRGKINSGDEEFPKIKENCPMGIIEKENQQREIIINGP